MSEESKRKLAAALIALGVCTAATACGYVDNMSPADAAKLAPAVQSLDTKGIMGTNMITMIAPNKASKTIKQAVKNK